MRLRPSLVPEPVEGHERVLIRLPFQGLGWSQDSGWRAHMEGTRVDQLKKSITVLSTSRCYLCSYDLPAWSGPTLVNRVTKVSLYELEASAHWGHLIVGLQEQTALACNTVLLQWCWMRLWNRSWELVSITSACCVCSCAWLDLKKKPTTMSFKSMQNKIHLRLLAAISRVLRHLQTRVLHVGWCKFQRERSLNLKKIHMRVAGKY